MGFSPCPTAGESPDFKWLPKLLKTVDNPQKLAVLAVGRDAIAQALSLAQKRKEVQLVVMMKPKVLAPKQPVMTTTDDLSAWLKEQGHESSVKAAATAMWWAAGAEKHEIAEPTFKKPSQSCQVTLVYEEGDDEDEDFVTSLDNQGIEVKTRSASKDEVLADILTEEVQKALDDVADDTL